MKLRLALPAGVAVAVLIACAASARLAAPREPGNATSERGRVVSVHDGDTITVRLGDDSDKEKVRLIGIDTPELDSERNDVRALGYAARDYARSRLAGSEVTLRRDSRQPDRDKYGRLLRYVILDDGTNFNEELVRKGYAEVYNRFSFDLKDRFKEVEAEAKREQRPYWLLSPPPDRTR